MAPVPNAGAGFSPLDDELALPPGQLTPLLREWVVQLGSWVPFVQVPRLLASFAHLSINRETARRLTEAAGTELLAAQTAAAVPLAPPADPGAATDERLQVSADGAMVRLKSGDWVEVKTVAVGRVEQRTAADGRQVAQTSAISYFSRHAEAAEFSRDAVVELHRRGVRRASAVAGVMDGALWLQGFLNYHRADAVRILDLPHAAEHLGKLAVGLWGEGKAAQQWQHEQVRVLREDGAPALLRELARMAEEQEQNEAFSEHGEYLRRRAEQMAYPAFRAAGWPIGSGIVESGNKVVVEARLKGAGMGWAVNSLNPMLALRNGVCNDRWAESWATIWSRQQPAQQRGRQQPQLGRVAQHWAPAAAAPLQVAVDPEIVAEVEAILGQVALELAQERAGAAVVNGKPGPGHPWRRSPVGRCN